MLQDKIQHLASQLFSTKPEDLEEPYILTPEEEETAIQNEIASLKKHYAWRMNDKGEKEGNILQKLSEIDWDKQVSRKEVLARANSSKNYDLWQKEQRRKEAAEAIQKHEELKQSWSAKTVLGLMKWTSENTYGKKLIIHENNSELIKAICFFLSMDPRFETELGYSFQKGLLIRGVAGLGKTFLIKCVAENGLNPVQVLSMIEIIDHVKADGEYNLQMGRCKKLYLDDVGTETTPVKHYGTEINWFKDFLELYYSRNKPFSNLLISTNNNFSDIETKYGFRVRSRMKDMFNVIDVTGKDMRG